MSDYKNGYRPTMNLRQYVLHGHTSQAKKVLQQQWISDHVGFSPVWRDVPLHWPEAGDTTDEPRSSFP